MVSTSSLLTLLVLVSCAIVAVTAQNYTEVKLQVIETATPTTMPDEGTYGFGDSNYFRNQLTDFRNGTILGHSQGTCLVTASDNIRKYCESECTQFFVFAAGSISMEGQFLNTPSSLAVTGGTGIYSRATGVCVQSTLSSDGNGTFQYGYNCEFSVLNPPIRDPIPLALTIGAPPVNGACSARAYPNQCYASDRRSSICCPAECPLAPTITAVCA
ncbi:hypothetical protein KFL_000770210 [Klebsormidium nitens]|uniref:Dirigent protein n=1 Tax=Klebsormidium nitens TaxID=105231 RepID=A0A1Y1HZP6_KLENI|nr:hypothetical protein KFL_000770210 [Klebsormidium nitens]|eukprot:GAQ81328.1 hypothetical protein KFL_000770210 [Klebsormidium nitens]